MASPKSWLLSLYSSYSGGVLSDMYMKEEQLTNRLRNLNIAAQREHPGNYKIVWDDEGLYCIDLIFDSEEDKTMWLLTFK